MTMAVLSKAVLFLFSSLSAKVLSAFMSTHSVFLSMEKKVFCTWQLLNECLMNKCMNG